MSVTIYENSPPAYSAPGPASWMGHSGNTQVPAHIDLPPPYPGSDASPAGAAWQVTTAEPRINVTGAAVTSTEPSSPSYQTFLKGKPKILGTVMIFSANVELALGVAMTINTFPLTFQSGVAILVPFLQVIAGCLSIAAEHKRTICLLKGSFAFRIISSIFTVIAMILIIHDVALLHCDNNDYECGHKEDTDEESCKCPQDVVYGFGSTLLFLNLLVFCISLSFSIFGCRSLPKVTEAPQVFLIQNDVVVSMNPVVSPGFAQTPPPPTNLRRCTQV
ncbi:membrane-spanning 4-domains subfamily A member 4A-like isoform X1 [Engystomops pustulosus]|uniref:membrane-spanning 4-domains subfamily A member 4A-like isoform X1 n=1 Tax=Engystomops pustulosus TaxID=76066 RepID=UPI003AFA93C2